MSCEINRSFFFFQAEDGIRDGHVTGVQTCALPIFYRKWSGRYPPGTTHNTEHVFGLAVPNQVPVKLAPREHLRYVWLPWREAAARCFSWTNRAAIEALPDHARVQLTRT